MGLVSPDGKIVDRFNFATQPLSTVDLFLKKLAESIHVLIDRQPQVFDLLGIGIGAPGHSLDTGIMQGAVNLPFRDSIPVGPFLQDRFSVPTFLIKDSKAAALGEKHWGAGQQIENFVLLMLGTGLGYAAYINGQIVNGMLGLAGELGHLILVLDGRHCNCGKKGCAETYISATVLKRTAFELLATEVVPSPLREKSFQEVDTRIIGELALAGDPIAQKAYQRTGIYLGTLMANLTEQLTPARFLLAGGLAQANELLLEPARKTLEENIQPIYRDRIDIAFSALGPSEVGILGAAALVLEHNIYQP
jgi:glucokinase